MKCVPEVANWKSFLRSALEILKPGFFSKSKSTAISTVSANGMPVNKLQTSYGHFVSKLCELCKFVSYSKNISFKGILLNERLG